MRRPLSLSAGAAVLSLVLSACNPSTPVTPVPSSGLASPSAASSPAVQPTGPVAIGSPAPSSGVAGLILAEVGFAPRPSEPQFVEIANPSSAAIPITGLTLRIGATVVPLAPIETALASGERLLVALDGPKDPANHVIHVGGAQLSPAGSVQLLDAGGGVLDAVAWGVGQPHAVALSTGDFAADTVTQGSTIGRPPGAVAPHQPTDWVPYPPASATPGAPNPLPQVAVLLPIDGALVDAQGTLAWYPVLGAASYRVQIAPDASFTAPAVDTTVTEPQVDVASLAAGRYVWHVQALGTDGAASAMSETSGFEKTAGIVQVAPAAFHPGDPDASDPLRVDVPLKDLRVPWLVQHKDTAMLLLEEPHEHAPSAWDTPHNPASGTDPADANHCAVAMIAMVNHFYGGDLSQDRIAYEAHKERQPGPEEDLIFGEGLRAPEANMAFSWALGVEVEFVGGYLDYDTAWAAITSAIDAGRPVPAANKRHGFVISGYEVRNGKRLITVKDPAKGTYVSDLDASTLSATDLSLWIVPDGATGTKQEASVTTDSDGDGVVDFDETERFLTNPNAVDSDEDKVKDKQDVASGIFDPAYGYALHRAVGGKGRDFDGDSNPTEGDPDSDDGGCQDGEEDKDVDGHRNGAETWNFDKADDACHDLTGTITFDRQSTNDAGNGETSEATLHATIDVKLKVDPNDPTHLIDAGSSYSVKNVFTSQRPNGLDCSPGRHISRSEGTYRFKDPPVPSPGHSVDELGLTADTHPDIWAYVDRARGLIGITIIPWFPEKTEDTCQLFTGSFNLPIIIDDWACGSAYSGLNLSIDATIKEAPSGGPLPVTVDCTQEGPAFLWQKQKVTAKGQLNLVGH